MFSLHLRSKSKVLKELGKGPRILLYVIILHLLAGVVAGAGFNVRTLMIMLGFVFAEPAILSFAHIGIAAPLVFINLVVVQVGYLAGIYGRGIFEHVIYSSTSVRTRRTP